MPKIKKELKLSNVDILSFTKEKSQLYRYLKSAKLFVLLSELEGFSIISFEAMAAGLPVITLDSKRNALKEYISNGKNGYVCKKDRIEIGERIRSLLADKALNKSMSANSKETGRKFSSKNMCPKIEKIYRKIIENESN